MLRCACRVLLAQCATQRTFERSFMPAHQRADCRILQCNQAGQESARPSLEVVDQTIVSLNSQVDKRPFSKTSRTRRNIFGLSPTQPYRWMYPVRSTVVRSQCKWDAPACSSDSIRLSDVRGERAFGAWPQSIASQRIGSMS